MAILGVAIDELARWLHVRLVLLTWTNLRLLLELMHQKTYFAVKLYCSLRYCCLVIGEFAAEFSVKFIRDLLLSNIAWVKVKLVFKGLTEIESVRL